MGDEELDDGGVGGGQVQARAENLDERDAFLDVAMALGLADVVQQHAEHQQLRLLHLAEDLGRSLGLRRLARRQRTHVLDGEPRVLVGRELVVDVVLHQTGQRAELGQIASEDAELVHLRERHRHPPPRPADVEEQLPHRRRAAKVVVDQVERLLDRSLELDGQLAPEPMQMPEHLHEPRRVGGEHRAVAVGEIEAPVDEDEAVGQRLMTVAPLGDATHGDRLLAARDEPARDAMNGARVEVVLAHEPLDVEAALVPLVAEVPRDSRLHVPAEHVVLVAGEEMKLVANTPQEGEGGVRRRLLAWRDQPLVVELAQRARAELRGGQPHRRVHVAQATRRLLDVRLADVGRRAVFAVPLVALGQGRRQELLEVALVDVLLEHSTEPGEQPAVAGEEPRRRHGRSAGQVGPGDRDTVRQRAQAVADLESEVPQRVEQLLGHPLDVRGQLSVVDHHEVDVGRRMELATAVTAQGDDDERGCRQTIGVACNELRQRLHEVVHHAGMGLQGLLAGRPTGAHDLHGVEPHGDGCTEEVEPESPPVVRPVGLGLGAPGPVIQLGRHDEAERSNPRRILSNRTRTYYNAKMRCIWRAAVDRIAPYDPGLPLEALASDLGRTDLVRLSANESPLGPSPRVVEAIAREAARVHLYPDGGSTSLRQALAARLGVAPAQIVVGNGADELLALIGWAALEPGDEVIIPQPSFEPYTTVVELMAARVVPSPLAKYETDLDDMASRLTARTKAIVLCSPHNPAGTIIRRAPLTAFLDALGDDAPLTLLDEAYCDFCDDPEYPDGVTLLAPSGVSGRRLVSGCLPPPRPAADVFEDRGARRPPRGLHAGDGGRRRAAQPRACALQREPPGPGRRPRGAGGPRPLAAHAGR